MRKWQGGLTKHPSGWIAYVPQKEGAGIRYYNACKKRALEWQDKTGPSIWGEKWPAIKKHGVCRIIEKSTKSKAAKKAIKIADGVVDRTSHRITNAGTLSVSYQIQASYMTLIDGKKKQSVKSFSYNSKKSGRTREEAKALALKVRSEKVQEYQAQLRKLYIKEQP